MDPGTWGWSSPSTKEVNEIKGDTPSQITLKVGQKFSHELYIYRIEITKIEVIREEDSYYDHSIYNTADISVKAYIPKTSEESDIKIGEYEIRPKEINVGKWFLIEDSEG